MSDLLSFYIIFLVVGSIIFYSLLIFFTRKSKPSESPGEDHSFDGIKELNEPLPLWWLWLFIISIIFGILYLFLYPGLGSNKGILNWTSQGECVKRTQQEGKLYERIYVTLSHDSVEELSSNLKALKIGKSLFLNNCSICHGLDARGGNGFPNLTNNKWLYGGEPNDIKHTITNGRKGKMPSYSSILGSEEDVEATALYVLSLSGTETNSNLTNKGKLKFNTICSACHGINAKGNKYIGAPNLTDPQWVYGGKLENIINTIKNGRNGVMPAHKDILSKEQIHILTAYIYSLNKS
jgi:cytochrome c oxidase cbb3-type subunit 3